ncbi:MAG: flagellar biosynthesis protein FlhB [Defluviimonas sp.]|uniref:flagellar type III secretion system protein FlhB n=1 Tax=Albidovulum sp. TaxID=1872424 RepID=UPI002A28232B|nr:flagellar biosynthesis protein FlhB [Defluviimonas sp.]
MSGGDDSEREHEPTQRKLDEARRRGEVVRSNELSAAAALLGLIAALSLMSAAAPRRLADALMPLLSEPERFGHLLGKPGAEALPTVAPGLAAALLPVFLLPGAGVLIALFAQRAIVFAPDKLQFRLSRISPLANAGQKFGRSGLAEFGKSALKLVVVSILAVSFLFGKVPEILAAPNADAGVIAGAAGGIIVAFLRLAFVTTLVFGTIDYLWQRSEHIRRNRMSRQEMVDEFKESEGDPHIRAQRRQRAEAIATNRMLTDVPKADVVIVNPTHYAVALRWARGKREAPKCVAKGTDEVARRIREAAAGAGVPIRSDPPTARALFAEVEIGREIRPEHYAAVAAAIRFAEAMRQKARRRSWS